LRKWVVTMTDKLLPCPFCGKQVALIDNCHELEDCENFERCEATDYYAVVCDVNEGGCGASGGYARTEQEAIAAWNRRSDAMPVVRGEWFDRGSLSCRCSECGCKSNKEYTYCPNCGAKMDKEAQDERND
jgi:Lar family restriction alleviation protein